MNRLSARIVFLLTPLFIVTNCSDEPPTSKASTEDLPLFSLISPLESGIYFSNDIEEDIKYNITAYDYYYNGGGVAVGDINNDGLPDIFFTGNNVSNRLYLNKGNFKFEDISKKADIQTENWSTGVTMVDINNDGLLDIYVCNSGPYPDKKHRTNQLFINNGNLTFSEKAAEYGIANTGHSTQASFFDYDKDGDLDLYVMNHSLFEEIDKWLPQFKEMSLNDVYEHCGNLYMNNGNNTFSDISRQAGIFKPGFGLGLITSDINHDGWIDIYVANDYFVPDFMYLNRENGSFVDDINNRTSHISYYSMGADATDFNNDGLLDLGIVDMTPADHKRSKVLMASMDVNYFRVITDKFKYQPQYMFNALQVNNGFGFFSEIGLSAGVAKTDWSWTALFADFDNDGFKDYLVTNGFRRDTKNNDWRIELKKLIKNTDKESIRQKKFAHLQKAASNPITNFVFKNNGNYTFEDKSYDWGFREPSFSNGAAYADLDLDGDLDLVINNIDKEAFVFRNNAVEKNGNNFIRFEILDQSGKNPAYNSKVSIYYGSQMQYAELHPVRGYQSSVESILHFGLKDIAKIDSVKIEWLSGSQTIITNLKTNKTHTISQKNAALLPFKKQKYNPLFVDISSSFSKALFKHQENDFDDFAKEILLPHRQSMLGPFISVGDVNGDQAEDFFIGGAKGQSGQLFLQQAGGGFSASSNQAWASDIDSEDMGSLFFDADADGDLDLYVASGGGGEFNPKDPKLQDRLYLNNGTGVFKKAQKALPRMPTSSGKVKGFDYDKDGDTDLFVSGRTTPGKYPFPADSYLLRNDGGKFTDVTDEVAPQLRQLGMVTDAVWTDFDKDGLTDLFVVGEWMGINCFKNTDGKFENVSDQYNLSGKTGWWYSIIAADFDKDGDEDFIVGNVGSNNKFQPSEKKPLHVYCNDFDQNGTLDIVLSKSYKNNLVPVRGKECSTAQMPFVSEKFPTYKAFSESSLAEIYGEKQLAEALHYSANTFQSFFIENKGGEGFEFHELPVEAQFAPINAILAKDFDGDGNIDVVIAGNNFQTEVETPQYDAGKGLFLKGNGDGTFNTSIRLRDSGIMLPKDTKDLKLIAVGKQKIQVILVANNNDKIQFLAVFDERMATLVSK
jgi:enediyne biosynthesis protein E4